MNRSIFFLPKVFGVAALTLISASAAGVAQTKATCEAGKKGYPECVKNLEIIVKTKSGTKVFKGDYRKATGAAEAYIRKSSDISSKARAPASNPVSRIGSMLKSGKSKDVSAYWEITCTIGWPPSCTITFGGG